MSLEGSLQVVLLEVGGQLSSLIDGATITFEVNEENRIAGKAVNRFTGNLDPGSVKPFGPPSRPEWPAHGK